MKNTDFDAIPIPIPIESTPSSGRGRKSPPPPEENEFSALFNELVSTISAPLRNYASNKLTDILRKTEDELINLKSITGKEKIGSEIHNIIAPALKQLDDVHTSIFNSISTGIAATIVIAGVGLAYNSLRGQTKLDQNTSEMKAEGRIHAVANNSFMKNKKLQSIVIEGNDRAYVFLRDGRSAYFDLTNKNEVFSWWKAQNHLNEPEEIHKMASAVCEEELPKETIAYSRYKAVKKRNGFLRENFFKSAGTELDKAMISQVEGLVKAPKDASLSGLCHIAVKTTNDKDEENIIVRPVMGEEAIEMEKLREEGNYKRENNIPANTLIIAISNYHKKEIDLCHTKCSAQETGVCIIKAPKN